MERVCFRYLRLDKDFDDLAQGLPAYDLETMAELKERGWITVDQAAAFIHILENHLTQAKPFKTDDPEVINASPRTRKARTYSCLNRTELIFQLAFDLWEYENARFNIDRKAFLDSYTDQRRPPDWDDALAKVGEAVDFVQNLRRLGALPKETKCPQDRKIDEAFETIRKVVQIALGEPDPDAGTLSKKARVTLDQNLRGAFKKNVPEANEQDILYAVASVLSHFGIEDGEIPQIAERLRKRRERAKTQ